ncbi:MULTISPECIES: tRNA (adenosine(37)-N6)-threonylcarbamoyltransferase complex ATPase subunit type 1 TsaE [Nocardioides]|uniref:tRNA threonylcarbamoyladenosine biosynthesis protein TsaE n=1 Tax=Nocardioides kribbensis TaxID=305517 RepID=A0ABV1P483_9ACTN|nr:MULTISPECIES: tRNA (adenosine(37)-N6)-threonylcarbamoyltransferase complex ATPase subunit type 1 TsaE [Nocardioides]KQP64270.1 tRNA threonylcarbamoyladenosine biosynthesis protein TsaE [Nocardioides sp. Leaf285]KQQ43299.1 tRNA threonylcarbamoyladenosine biosynthesis protein TsaE [Nocardioides sp. Leaf307]MCM3515990.1 tRNA (adenosine(37)-N6)-threonylcarbamoyltransferase complex ATPase subunit type 1 TsaE [Nocardioides sp. P86]
MTLTVRQVGPEHAREVLEVVRAAFSARPPLDPPADALGESVETIAERLSRVGAGGGGLLACLDGEPVGAVVLDPVGSTTYLRRFAVSPDHQGHGIAGALIEAAVEAVEASGTGTDDLTVVAREELPRTVRFWERQGFKEILRYSPHVEMRRPLRTAVWAAPTAEAMRGIGRSLAGQLTRGDLIVLTGELGAGKTTFTQGLGAGLGVRGGVTSPTFVIARVHPSEVGGPQLVHVDAYRLGGLDELDDLDLDTSLSDAVTVVEWGAGLAEGLSESRLEINIVRDLDPEGSEDPRRVEITPVGPRWHALSFRALG